MDELEALCQIIDRHRQPADDSARLAPEVRVAAGKAGLWVLAAPKEVGGLELSLPDLAAVFTTVAEADPTVAWHAANSLGLGMVAAALGETECRAVFADRDRPYGYSGAATQASARPEGDGYRLDGAWPFMTGAVDAGWTLVSAAVDEGSGADGPPEVRRFAIPLDALDVGDNWAVSSAMRGTGSHAVATPEGGVFVAGGCSIPLTPQMRLDRPLYRLPLIPVFVGMVPPMCLGALRRATVGTIELVGEKVSRLDRHAHVEDVRVQQAIADASAEHLCLAAGYRDILEEVWAAAEAGDPLPEELRARFWSTLFLTVDRSREQVSRLFSVATSAVYATRNPVERASRDIHAVSASLESFQALRWAAARVMLGHEPRHPAF